MAFVKNCIIGMACAAVPVAASGVEREALGGMRADAIMDGFSVGGVAPVRDADGNERWHFDEVFCTVGFASIVCRLVAAGEEKYVQGGPAETIARGIVGPFSTLYNIYADQLTCTRGPSAPSACVFIRS